LWGGVVRRKVGDVVRIRPNLGEFYANTFGAGWDLLLDSEMLGYAGEVAKVVSVREEDMTYRLDIDGGKFPWKSLMFDPGFSEDGMSKQAPVSEGLPEIMPKDAILAMLDGETLCDQNGVEYFWGVNRFFLKNDGHMLAYAGPFEGLRRHSKSGCGPFWSLSGGLRVKSLMGGWFAEIKD
jgi:hypothetical protein